MIFHQHIKTRIGEIWIVDATENGFNKLDSETRQEFERRVLDDLVVSSIGNEKLSHGANGAPFIENRPDLFISISHSENWFALYISQKQVVGVDIEVRSTKIEAIKTHFLSDREIQHLDPNLLQLHICWGIKESIIKLNGGEVVDFKNEIQIEEIGEQASTATFEETRIQLAHVVGRQFVLVSTN